jgi:pimeloyl-ACP methyl ester carboxylesterase
LFALLLLLFLNSSAFSQDNPVTGFAHVDKDAPEILTVAGMLKAGIASSTMRVIKNTNHHLVMEKPRKYNRIVLDFLQKD